MPGRYRSLLLAALLLCTTAMSAVAAPYDTPSIVLDDAATVKFTMTVTAGPSGMPDGFSVYWMTQLDYENYGSEWPTLLSYPGLHWANFTGIPTLNTFDGGVSTFALGPNESVIIELGDLEDETGVVTNTPEELAGEENYVVCVFANGGSGGTRSDYSLNAGGNTIAKKECVHSQGYWKTHSSAWPVSSLILGTVSYTKAQLLSILNKSANGNGLISLAKQLIAAKLNIANGANIPTIIASTIAAADAQIGALVVPPVGSGSLPPSSTSSKTQKLDDFNNGKYHAGCGSTATVTSTWGRLKTLYRQ